MGWVEECVKKGAEKHVCPCIASYRLVSPRIASYRLVSPRISSLIIKSFDFCFLIRPFVFIAQENLSQELAAVHEKVDGIQAQTRARHDHADKVTHT